VRTPGGDLVVEKGPDGHLYQSGPAAHVFDGALP
jgi:diaminopimelate epimerase